METGLQGLRTLVDVWLAPQVQLPHVLRWRQLVCVADGGEFAGESGARPQNTLQHSHSLGVLADIIIASLLPYHAIDDPFLLSTCIRVHDHGEGEVGHDTLYEEKSVAGDIGEYVGFYKRILRLDPAAREHLNRAFLLQFCLKGKDDLAQFPDEAREVMQELAETKRKEALLFAGIEHFDYFVYAAEQYFNLGHRVSMEIVAKNQLHPLRRFAEMIPGYAKEVWTQERDDWLSTFAPQAAVA